jgi:hypothetical protein
VQELPLRLQATLVPEGALVSDAVNETASPGSIVVLVGVPIATLALWLPEPLPLPELLPPPQPVRKINRTSVDKATHAITLRKFLRFIGFLPGCASPASLSDPGWGPLQAFSKPGPATRRLHGFEWRNLGTGQAGIPLTLYGAIGRENTSRPSQLPL